MTFLDLKLLSSDERPPENGFSFSVSISGIWNWLKDRKIKKDIDNIKKWNKEEY